MQKHGWLILIFFLGTLSFVQAFKQNAFLAFLIKFIVSEDNSTTDATEIDYSLEKAETSWSLFFINKSLC